jgi:hypothetical protein
MPNHMHGIIALHPVGAPLVGAQNDKPSSESPPSLGDVLGAFKSITTNAYIENVHHQNWQPFSLRLWQRNYYETIIRNESHLKAIRDYIVSNPANWPRDEYNIWFNINY